MAERLAVERPDIVQRRAADIHAEPDRGRELDAAPDIHRAARGVDAVHVEAERRRDAGDAGIAADRGVVRERRDRGHARHRIGLRGKPAQPAVRDHRVAVQQRDIVGAGRLHAAIDRGDEPEVAGVVQQGDAPGARQRAQPGDEFRFGRAVLHHDHAAGGAIGVRQHRLQTLLGLPQSAIGGDDDVDHDTVRTGGRKRRRGQVVADLDRLLGLPAAPGADPDVVRQRIGRGLRMHLDVVGGIEARVRIAQLGRAPGQVMQQRGQSGWLDIRVADGVPGAVEEPVRIAPLGRAEQREVHQRIEIDRAQLGVFRQVPLDVEECAQLLGGSRVEHIGQRRFGGLCCPHRSDNSRFSRLFHPRLQSLPHHPSLKKASHGKHPRTSKAPAPQKPSHLKSPCRRMRRAARHRAGRPPGSRPACR